MKNIITSIIATTLAITSCDKKSHEDSGAKIDSKNESITPTLPQAEAYLKKYVTTQSGGNLKYVSVSKKDGKLETPTSYRMFLDVDCIAQINCRVSRDFRTCDLDTSFIDSPTNTASFNSHVKSDIILVFEKRESGWIPLGIQ